VFSLHCTSSRKLDISGQHRSQRVKQNCVGLQQKIASPWKTTVNNYCIEN